MDDSGFLLDMRRVQSPADRRKAARVLTERERAIDKLGDEAVGANGILADVSKRRLGATRKS
ncbi:MAG TPA: hypothetical protein VJS15_08640 [Allosphingosinicella sp.]|nr:hypothetical protein [Allosphingosinicella sp.]